MNEVQALVTCINTMTARWRVLRGAVSVVVVVVPVTCSADDDDVVAVVSRGTLCKRGCRRW